MALLEIKNLHVALEDGTEIVRGRRPRGRHRTRCTRSWGRTARARARSPTRSWAIPRYEITEGEILFDGEDVVELEADERAQRGLFLAFQYPHAVPGVTVANFLRAAINAIRKAKAGGEDDPIKIPEFRKDADRGDGAAQDAEGADLALPERRLLGRREEAGRDPPDGDAQAADRGARRDRLRPRHRRAADRRRGRAGSSSARRWARS